MANKYCTNCGNKLSDGDSFCGSCGNQLVPEEIPKFCVNCGNSLEAGVEFCNGCGSKVTDSTPPGNPDKLPNESIQTGNPPSYSEIYDPPANKKSGPGIVKKIILGIISLFIPIAGFVIGGVYFFRKKEKVLGAVYAGLGLLAIIGVANGIESDSMTTQKSEVAVSVQPTPEPEPISVSLRVILDLRDGNEVAADAKYIGMYVTMEGEISQIHEKDITIIPLDSDMFQMAGAKCSFDRSQTDELIQLRKGDKITIIGTIKDIDDFGYNVLDVKPCVFERRPWTY